MKKCFFIGMSELLDVQIVDRLYDECEAVIKAEDMVEFWFFHREADAFNASCLCLAVRLRTKYPDKVRIVRVFDPVKDDEQSDWYRETFNSRLPRCIPDRNVFAPAMDDGVAKIETAFALQYSKIERWILRQMDIVFAYYYLNLEDSVIAQVEFARKSPNTEVKHIFFEETEKRIQEKADTMFDERTTTILAMLKDNVPQKEIAKTVGITTSRIGQIAHKAARSIRGELKRSGVRVSREKDWKCGLYGLSSEATAFQLVVFESLLTYLTDVFHVKEFWIDEKSCNTVYGAILAKYCAQRSSIVKAKVVVSINDDDPAAWDNCIREYAPPYESVVNLGLETADEYTLCEEMTRQCRCVITDFALPCSNKIRKLCSMAEKSYLFDIPRKRYEIDEQYER